ncbi:uncharacterized protein A4U43_C09F4320 [Asparagus officinalis]|uniref:Pentacotripeptide-repeat region of PRORP domain-containing protein n=1 Tax=Asparagus officinalis TaxID=4686 RepID=A0A5P1E5H3_ASPOF|nr:pentatricopeptide repeat-containing protein At3g53700, chloroplastic-like isoform X2 [Asparagus officinalis]ONK57810.1 uncharacterized protein A4U43_C09F4320 [Asparagus officinalis]
MLKRQKPHPLPSLSLAINLLQSSPFSSNPNPNPNRALKTLTKGPANALHIYSPNPIPPRSSSNPNTQLILSLLSQPPNPSSNLDTLLKDFKPQLNSALVLEILNNYKILGRPRTLEFFSWAGFQLEFRFDDSVVEFMADFLGRRKLFDDVKCLLRAVSSNKGRVSTRAVAICIRFLGRQGRVLDALALFEMMELEFGCCPDNLVFNNVLYVLCKKDLSENYLDIALLIFRKIQHPDEYSYSNIIIGLCKFGRLENAFEVFHQMSRGNLVPTKSAANVLVGSLCEMSSRSRMVEKVRVTNVRRPFDILVPNVRVKFSIEPAFRAFWAILKLGLMPSAHIVNGLISELCRVGKFDEAVETVKVVENRKLRCVHDSYSIVIIALCEVRRVHEACNLFERMVILGLKPKVSVYNSIICVYCKLGNVDEAGKYFEIMNKRRCEPNCGTYTMLINAYCVIQNWELAYRLLIEMIELGWNPHVDTYKLVDGLLNKNGRSDLSLKLERKMAIQNVCGHCKAGRLEAACDGLNSMLAKGFQLPIYARDTIQRAFKKCGGWKVAQELLEKMDNGGRA